MKNILIIGYGQIGQSVHGLYDSRYNVFVKDATDYIKHNGTLYTEDLPHIDVCHLAYTYNEETFVDSAVEYICKYEPHLTIIESTVSVGTTRKIDEKIKEYTGIDFYIVHSPVTGKHPNLTTSMRMFRKIIGSTFINSSNIALLHYQELGVTGMIYNNPEETELAKMLCTTYYGWNIMYMKKVHDLCEELGLDFENVYTKWNNNYNAGYTQLQEPRFVRPVLKYMGAGIGGHCVYQNAVILKKHNMITEIASLIASEGWNEHIAGGTGEPK